MSIYTALYTQCVVKLGWSVLWSSAEVCCEARLKCVVELDWSVLWSSTEVCCEARLKCVVKLGWSVLWSSTEVCCEARLKCVVKLDWSVLWSSAEVYVCVPVCMLSAILAGGKDVIVSFPQQPNWTGSLSEMERVSSASSASYWYVSSASYWYVCMISLLSVLLLVFTSYSSLLKMDFLQTLWDHTTLCLKKTTLMLHTITYETKLHCVSKKRLWCCTL